MYIESMLTVINDRGAWREGGGIHELQWTVYSCACEMVLKNGGCG